MNYKDFYEKQAAFICARPKLKQALIYANWLLTGLFALSYVLLLGYGFSKMEVGEIAQLIFIPALTLFLVWTLQQCIDRPRPYDMDGANITPILIKKKTEHTSFPSRPAASAFVIGMIFLPHFTGVGVILLALAFAVAYLRFMLGLHYPSDVIGGSVLGILVGGVIFLL